MAIIFCAAGLAGSLIEQIDGSKSSDPPLLALQSESRTRRQDDNSTTDVITDTTMAAETEVDSTVEDNAEIVRFTIGEFNAREYTVHTPQTGGAPSLTVLFSVKICELAALAVGMLFGIFALFSVVIERKCK